jgi:hypothetical protein
MPTLDSCYRILSVARADLGFEYFDVSAEMSGERAEILGIGRDDVVAVVGEHDDGRIHDVTRPRTAEQLAGCAPEVEIERPNVDSVERFREQRLARTSPAPHLTDHAAV